MPEGRGPVLLEEEVADSTRIHSRRPAPPAATRIGRGDARWPPGAARRSCRRSADGGDRGSHARPDRTDRTRGSWRSGASIRRARLFLAPWRDSSKRPARPATARQRRRLRPPPVSPCAGNAARTSRLARRNARPTIDLGVPREIGADEQQVADLVLKPVACRASSGSRATAANSTRTSSISSCSLAITGSGPGQSKPTRAARCCSFTARCHSGIPRAMPASARCVGIARRQRVRRVCALPMPRVCASASPTAASANTCGCRRTILSQIAATTSPKSKAPCSSAMRAWNTTCSSRSPSSSRRSAMSLRSIASATS